MNKRVKIPKYAKMQCEKGLDNLKKGSVRFTSKEAKDIGIYTGKYFSNKIRNARFLEESDLKNIAFFYHKFKNDSSETSEEAFLLRGGRDFCKLISLVY